MWYRTFAVNTSERALPWHTVKGVEYVCTTFINVSWRVEESSERLNKTPASCELFTCSCVKRKMARTQCPFMLCSTTNSVPTFSQPYLRDEETQTEKCPTSCHFWSPDVVFFSFSLSKMWERWGEKKKKYIRIFLTGFCILLTAGALGAPDQQQCMVRGAQQCSPLLCWAGGALWSRTAYF